MKAKKSKKSKEKVFKNNQKKKDFSTKKNALRRKLNNGFEKNKKERYEPMDISVQ